MENKIARLRQALKEEQRRREEAEKTAEPLQLKRYLEACHALSHAIEVVEAVVLLRAAVDDVAFWKSRYKRERTKRIDLMSSGPECRDSLNSCAASLE